MEDRLTNDDNIFLVLDRLQSHSLTINFNNYLNKINKVTINKYFKNIDQEEKNFLILCYRYLLDYIYLSLFKDEEIFWKQMLSNNSQDLETIFLLLLPFLKNSNTSGIKSLNNLIYDKSEINLDEQKETELRKFSKDLKYTNTLISLINNQRKGKIIIDYQLIILTHLDLTLNTIRKINGKMMINWQNIWPKKYDIIDSSKTKLNRDFLIPDDEKYVYETLNNLNLINNFILNNYTENPEELDIDSVIELNEIIMRPEGLWIGDIYQHLCNRFYKSVTNCRFLIYSYSSNNRLVYGIELIDNILKNILNINEIDYSKKYYDYAEKEQKMSELKYQEFINNLDINNINNIQTNFILRLAFYLIELNEVLSLKIKKQISRVNFIELDNEFRNLDEQILELRVELLDLLKNIEFKDIYNFILSSIERFKVTPYYRFIFKDNKIDFKKFDEEEILNIKWIYNWAKSLVHIRKQGLFTTIGNYFETNYINITFKIITKLFRNDWFNIDRNLERSFNINIDSLDISSRKIHDKMVSLIDYKGLQIPLYLVFIFDDMLRNGILSDFKVNTKLTDKTKQSSDKKIRMKERGKILKGIFKENKYFGDCYYYWNNKKYNELEEYCITPKDDKPKKYFDYLCDGKTFEWSTYFSNDWVTQIDFYTHFLNQQVMYVTGSTGQGKSTQVPKLTTYGSKAYMYKNDGKIIGTQPRTGPTRGNISWISRELGIPVLDFYNMKGYKERQEMPTNNFNLQFKYQADKHFNNNKELKLTMATDGTLLNEISNSITLKKKLNLNNKNIRYSPENIYDVVMVDEAHEHNPNMDLILSLMRQTLYYNLEVRLLIISATMEDDEPLYRSYYSLLDDNHSYPYRYFSMNNIFAGIYIDANYFDRRFNISPPGGTTQYKVEEIYKPIPNLPKNLTEASKITQLESYKIVKEIADKNPSGEILLFLNGQGEINKAVEELNKILPRKTIALPFYTRLNNKYKDIIQGIEKYISTLKIKKEEVHTKWGEDYYEDPSVANNSYDRAVIIATNVAEASITIKRLKFVVDNGYSKENKYNPLLGPSLQVDEISESSRIQRKGRVGRVAPGTAYFLYEKGGREENPPKLKITQSDPISWMIPFIKNTEENINEEETIMVKKTDFHNFNDSEELKDRTKILSIIYKNYNIELLRSKNFVREFEYFKPPDIFYNMCDSFKNKDMLLDFNCNYWLIHPAETRIKRNIFYKIIEFNNKKTDKIPLTYQDDILKYLDYDKDISINNQTKQISNSNLSFIISKIEGELETTKNIATSILYGFALNIIPELVMTITLLNNFKDDLLNLLGKKDLLKLQKLSKYNSDLMPFIEVSKLILKSCNNNIIKDFNKYNKNFNYILEKEALKLKEIYMNKETRNKLSLEDIIYLEKIYKSGEWNNKNIIGKIISKTKYFKTYFKLNGFNFNLPEIYNLNNNINLKNNINDMFNELFMKCLVLKFNIEVLGNKKILIDFENIINKLNISTSFLDDNNDKILFSIIAGNERNFVINTSNYNEHNDYNINKDILVNIFGIKHQYKEIRYKPNYNTIINKNILQTFYSKTLFDNINYLNLVSNVPIEWLIILYPIYFSNQFKSITNKYNVPEIIYLENIVKNKEYLIKQYWNKLDDIYKNIINTNKIEKIKYKFSFH